MENVPNSHKVQNCCLIVAGKCSWAEWRSTSGVYTPGRATQGVKAIPICSAKCIAGMRKKNIFYSTLILQTAQITMICGGKTTKRDLGLKKHVKINAPIPLKSSAGNVLHFGKK
ncbi:hypothetical protein TNCV_4451091 [Trichonephila clavipes]|nr:hypothetical protein TNCV_4451091 [Trichonephila clavipes]